MGLVTVHLQDNRCRSRAGFGVARVPGLPAAATLVGRCGWRFQKQVSGIPAVLCLALRVPDDAIIMMLLCVAVDS